jgi:hypothetical protein
VGLQVGLFTLQQLNDPDGEKEWEDRGKGYLAKSPSVEYPIGLRRVS